MAVPNWYGPASNVMAFYVENRSYSDSQLATLMVGKDPSHSRYEYSLVVPYVRAGIACTAYLNDSAGHESTTRLRDGLQGFTQPFTKVRLRISVSIAVGMDVIHPVIESINYGWGTLLSNVIGPASLAVINLLRRYAATLIINPDTDLPFYTVHGCTMFSSTMT